jgi:asparagine synthase (glutamine-hydrolysing)
LYRYLALIWNPADQQSSTAALLLAARLQSSSRAWSRVLDQGGVCAFHEQLDAGASETRPLRHAAGAVFGKIFARDLETPASALRVVFDDAETSRVVATGGRRLFERYWGRYVAVVRDAVTGEAWILRDPSGGLPCLLTAHQGVNIVVSDLEDCLALGLPRFSVNWQYINGFVAHSGLQVRATALNEVSEVQAGERICFSDGALRRSIEWNPIDIAQGDPLKSSAEAVAALRSTTLACAHAWAACYRDLLLNLSGGLDSSIVLSCLRSAPTRPAVTCLTYFGTGPNEDERRYARLMAQRAEVELIEQPLDPAAMKLEDILKLRRTARPWFYLYELEHGPFEAGLAARKGANGLFSGAGGDGVFFQARAELAVTDYLFEHGPGPGLLRAAIDAARMSRKSIWPLLVQAVQARFFSGRWDPIAISRPLPGTIVNPSVIQAARRDPGLTHPWFTRGTRGVPPGILWHVTSISVPPSYYSSFVREPYPERTLPLLSQPLVELCLRIPTYLLIESGEDRALARRAFANDLPEEIVRRRAKGRADQHIRNIMDANLDFVRELMLDGLLVREGILNREALELYLSRDRSPADFQYGEILQAHLCTEAWLRSWLTSSSGSAS